MYLPYLLTKDTIYNMSSENEWNRGVDAILASCPALNVSSLLTGSTCLPSRLRRDHSLQHSKYIPAASSDAGWLLVSQPGSLGTCFMPIESAPLFRLPILSVCSSVTAGILPWFFFRFASQVGICVAWVLFQGCVHVREIWRDMTLTLT